ncbi:hypothetical protein ORV05_04855 [Amycolatopsis cynarae]|uniref:Uncharacterized protein n=1 Tax=Amycolatopsis cynarae TaxID=2995223 RepID=A0ABY7B465_9PSEU|nr:hypothetical protein [Amycolatopsis sp. HUAS 11-8]WAL67121.1 hypothetical protein ORV05_04855 [Amycolatopsis sp. HUAS 11-8]
MHYERRGLRARILRDNTTIGRGGYSDGPDIHVVYIVGEGIPPLHPVPEGAPVVVLRETTPGYVVARPEQGGGYAASGAYLRQDSCYEDWEKVFGHHLPIPLHDHSVSMINLQYLGRGELYRGKSKLVYMSQVLRRDLDGETVAKAPGQQARGYVRPATVDEWVERAWGVHRFIVKSPGNPAMAWTAFDTEEELRAFVAAYALTLTGSLDPGGEFVLTLPDTIGQWLPVTARRD